MNRRGFIFFFLACVFYSCINEISYKELRSKEILPDFVYLENDSFKINNQPYFPKLMNYSVQPRMLDKQLVLSPSIEYDEPKKFDSQSTEESMERMRAHFRAIKKMGFNAIRLVGLSNVEYDAKSAKISIEVFEGPKRRPLNLDQKSISKLMKTLQSVVDLAGEEGLKIMTILPRPMKDIDYTRQKDKYVSAILDRFRNNNVMFAYDFFNEPLYFDNSEQTHWKEIPREKLSAYKLVRKWKSQMERNAPYQLFTIGLAEPIEVFEWDPAILPLDFVSFHTYHPLRVPNEIYWYAKYIKKPWIVSETSLPADNDSIPYSDQTVFMKEVLQRIVNCGGQGIGWWQYQDVKWGPFEHNYTPLIKVGGKSYIDSNTFILGEFKDAAFTLPTLPLKKTGECDCHVNYYNMMGYHNYKVSGLILDQDGNPIEGAVIRGWNKYWNIGMNTFTNALGQFDLYSNDECVHFEISAPKYSKVKFDRKLEYNPSPQSLDLRNKDLEYHKNHFQWYMDSAYVGKSVFEFKKGIFDKFKTSAVMETIELEHLGL